MPLKRGVKIAGKEYASIMAAANAEAMSRQTLRDRCDSDEWPEFQWSDLLAKPVRVIVIKHVKSRVAVLTYSTRKDIQKHIREMISDILELRTLKASGQKIEVVVIDKLKDDAITTHAAKDSVLKTERAKLARAKYSLLARTVA